MPDQLPDNPTSGDVAAALRRVLGRLEEIDAALAANNRLRNIALVVATLCLISAAFSAGYALHSRDQANDAEKALREQVHINRIQQCSSARSTALAFREPQISADGTPEPIHHFIERMLAQRALLDEVVNLRCAAFPGFATFPYLRAAAIHEIEVVLHRSSPSRFKPPEPLRVITPNRSTGAAPGEAAGGKPTATVPTATTAPTHHAEHHPAATHTEGGGNTHPGGSGAGTQPAEGPPPVPEPSGPVTAPAESGSGSTTPEPAAPVEAAPPPRSGAGGAVEAIGELVCHLNLLGVTVCTGG